MLGLKEKDRRSPDNQGLRSAMDKNPPETNDAMRNTMHDTANRLATQDVSGTKDVSGVTGPATQGNNVTTTKEQAR